MMVNAEDRKIIEAEIERLERAYADAQDRYAYSGSPSTDRTMHKYQTLQYALEAYLTNNEDETKDRAILAQRDQLYKLKTVIDGGFRAKKIEGDIYLQLLDILRR